MAGQYQDEIGWTRVDDLLSPERAGSILPVCEQILADLGTDLRVRDKADSGTRRLVDVLDRVPETGVLLADLEPVIAQVLGGPWVVGEGTAPGSNLRPDLQRQSGSLNRHRDERRLTGPLGVGFVFSGHLLHAGTQNNSSAARPALQFTFGLESR